MSTVFPMASYNWSCSINPVLGLNQRGDKQENVSKQQLLDAVKFTVHIQCMLEEQKPLCIWFWFSFIGGNKNNNKKFNDNVQLSFVILRNKCTYSY